MGEFLGRRDMMIMVRRAKQDGSISLCVCQTKKQRASPSTATNREKNGPLQYRYDSLVKFFRRACQSKIK
jgi:hypothetical protein